MCCGPGAFLRKIKQLEHLEEPILLTRRTFDFGFIEKGLKDKRGGDLIDNPAVLLSGVPCLIQDLMGFVRGQPLVPHVDRQARELAQFDRECLRLCGLRARFSGKPHRIAYDDRRNLEFACQPAEGAEILAGTALSLKREDRLGG